MIDKRWGAQDYELLVKHDGEVKRLPARSQTRGPLAISHAYHEVVDGKIVFKHEYDCLKRWAITHTPSGARLSSGKDGRGFAMRRRAKEVANILLEEFGDVLDVTGISVSECLTKMQTHKDYGRMRKRLKELEQE
jgi:hypothetical protein